MKASGRETSCTVGKRIGRRWHNGLYANHNNELKSHEISKPIDKIYNVCAHGTNGSYLYIRDRVHSVSQIMLMALICRDKSDHIMIDLASHSIDSDPDSCFHRDLSGQFTINLNKFKTGRNTHLLLLLTIHLWPKSIKCQ